MRTISDLILFLLNILFTVTNLYFPFSILFLFFSPFLSLFLSLFLCCDDYHTSDDIIFESDSLCLPFPLEAAVSTKAVIPKLDISYWTLLYPSISLFLKLFLSSCLYLAIYLFFSLFLSLSFSLFRSNWLFLFSLDPSRSLSY